MTDEEARNILLTSVHPQTAEEAEAIGIAVKALEKMARSKNPEIPKEFLDGKVEIVTDCPNCGKLIGLCNDHTTILME